MVLPVLSQRTYPSVKDIDDCAVVATVWAAASSLPTIVYPTCTTFRAFAGNPDDPLRPDGLTIEQVERGSNGCWPKLQSTMIKTSSWNEIISRIRSGMPGSVALHSSFLPSRLRYNFFGTHQSGVHKPKSTGPIYFMNPLAPANTTPGTITEAELKRAMVNLISPTTAFPYRAEFFPKPAAAIVPLWGWDVDDDIKEAYGATAVSRKLRECGVDTWGQRINEVDLEAGLRARGMTYGTSVQLIDVRKLMRPGCGSS